MIINDLNWLKDDDAFGPVFTNLNFFPELLKFINFQRLIFSRFNFLAQIIRYFV